VALQPTSQQELWMAERNKETQYNKFYLIGVAGADCRLAIWLEKLVWEA
jgi:hypothetical protein